ncbi:MAG: TIGR04348 family glycosyltransferase [Pseudomonadota bacterium]|nr:TIGR04348 family glycosyltransferase [Pseudomonadota bacterium]
MKRPSIALVTPALADANNGNWQTARRWAQMLARDYRVTLCSRWEQGDEDLMIALHARRSAASIAAWHGAPPQRPLVLVLTGTDLYRDIDSDAAAQRSLAGADRIVVLNELGLKRLPPDLRSRAVVCLQSAAARRPLSKTTRHLRALMVGHLREEKSPETYFDAAMLLQGRDDILFDHIGAGLDPTLALRATGLNERLPNYRWLGAMPHAATRRRVQAAHVLVHASRMEGGAHVVIEAVVSGTPVLASRIDGNVGLLGSDYGGYFEWGDAGELALLLKRLQDEPATLSALTAQCALRAPLFTPETERRTLLELVSSLNHAFHGARDERT